MCDCLSPGFCKTLGRRMTLRLWQICGGRCVPPCPSREQYVACWRAEAAELAATGGIPPRGLGDVVARVLDATGIATIFHAVTGPCGGCQERQEKLNEIAPTLTSRPLTPD